MKKRFKRLVCLVLTVIMIFIGMPGNVLTVNANNTGVGKLKGNKFFVDAFTNLQNIGDEVVQISQSLETYVNRLGEIIFSVK